MKLTRKTMFGIGGATAALLLSAGAAFGVQGYNEETSHRCSDAVAAAGHAAAAAATAQEKASAARTLAAGAAGFDKADGSAAALTGLDTADSALGAAPTPECSTRDQAAALATTTEAVASKAAVLNDAAGKLSDHVETFRAAETKRIAAEKKAADEAAAAKKKADDAAAATQAADAAAAAEAAAQPTQVPAAPVQMAPAPVPAGVAPAPVRQVPLPAPAAPAPLPAPAPAPAPVKPPSTGGWTPPPAGSGGFHGCRLINGIQMCS